MSLKLTLKNIAVLCNYGRGTTLRIATPPFSEESNSGVSSFDTKDLEDELEVEFNRSSRRKRGMASKSLFIIPDFFCIFQTNFVMAT